MNKKYKLLSINSSNFGSTGSIMMGISEMAEKNNYVTHISYPSSKSNSRRKVDKPIKISNRIERNLHLKLSYETGMNGCYSKIGTQRFIRKISEISPDIIHLHNLHNCYINLEMLFTYLKNQKIPVVWTLHDCWAFTGQCPYFTMVDCDKWKYGCHTCPKYNDYPAARVDKTREMYGLKKKWFTGVDNLTLVTPSNWLKGQVELSFLKEYKTKVIYNGIDLSVFRPRETDFRKKHSLEGKTILLGVANPWSERKGLSVFKELSNKLGINYKIVLVGLEQKQIKELPYNILGLPKTDSTSRLTEIYSAADYFINPSIEETMGLVTVEAIACGTPAIVSNSTAVPEMLDNKCGLVVEENNSEGFFEIIESIEKKFKLEDLLEHAQKFSKEDRFAEYIDLYKEILKI